jgi:hypothetical protein
MDDNFVEGSIGSFSPETKKNIGDFFIFNKPEISLIFFFAFVFSITYAANAQELVMNNDLNFSSRLFGTTVLTKPHVDYDSTEQSVFGNVDSLFGQIQPKLLPDRMSFMEKFLWGENGFVRDIGLVGPLSSEERESELSIRRAMLTSHQIGGFATLALMLTADYFGQRVIDGNRRAGDTHQTLVTATIISYSLTALLAILSPPPLIRRDEESTTTLHKTLAWVHAAGMILTPILGSMIGGRRHFNIDKAHFHQISGYITTAIFASAMIVVTF